jgi:2-dehydro-3-deoxyphosphogluconate aldolase/(4S)-4-hydroxy-2-oxoglutarate aldolase
MTRDNVLRIIEENRLIAILRGDFEGREAPLAQALQEAGVRAVEVSTVSPGYARVLRALLDAMGGDVAVGVGTVLNGDHLDAAADAGARFMVAPNTNPAVIARARNAGMAVFPGALTPTEILQAVDAGADAVKLFPAATVGPEYLRALRGPLPHIRFIPTGGVSVDNMQAWFGAGAWAVAVGSELVRSNEAALEDWAGLRERVARFVDSARKRTA